MGIWVEEMKATDCNPVIILLYKQQGAKQPTDCDNLSDKDFVIALQTPLQAEIISNGRIICVDGTHGTNGYDFTLITVMVIDEYGEGFPVAWCISNREDQLLLINFFNALKQNVGNISLAWFMSDLAEQFYTAWVASFNNRPHKLVCIWHLDRAWRENLKQLNDSTLEATVYHNLRVLLEETDKHKFEILLKETITDLSNTVAFAKYFVTTWTTMTLQGNTGHDWLSGIKSGLRSNVEGVMAASTQMSACARDTLYLYYVCCRRLIFGTSNIWAYTYTRRIFSLLSAVKLQCKTPAEKYTSAV